MKLKICGMKENMVEVAQLRPDYLGFIFYEKSPRYCGNVQGLQREMALLPHDIKKVGVFVDAAVETVLKTVERYSLDVVQLHGSEPVDVVSTLRESDTASLPTGRGALEIWKVFSVRDTFDFSVLSGYEPYVDKFLFDTKGEQKGGNGHTFNWSVLQGYPSKIPFILSGGIGIDEIEEIRQLQQEPLPLVGIDVNSKFENAPGHKNLDTLRLFLKTWKGPKTSGFG